MIKLDQYDLQERLAEIATLEIQEITEAPNEPVFLVDLNTREVHVPDELKEPAIYMDHNAQTIWFSISRYFDGKDLFNKDIVTPTIQMTREDKEQLFLVSYLYKEDITNKNEDINFPISEIESGLIGWTLPMDVTDRIGSVELQLRFFQSDESNNYEYILNTKPFYINIGEGKFVTAQSENIVPPVDALTSLIEKVDKIYSNTEGITISYSNVANKPKINGVTLLEDTAFSKLKPSYNDLVNKPKINNREISGNLEIQLDTAETITSTDTKAAQSKAVYNYVTGEYVSKSSLESGDAADVVNGLIDAKLRELTFTPITINSFTLDNLNKYFAEIETTITDITANWELNKNAKEVFLQYEDVEVAVSLNQTGSYLLSNLNITQDTIFKLIVKDGMTDPAPEATAELKFVPGIFYGVSQILIPDAEVIRDFEAEFRGNRLTTITVDAQNEQDYIFIALPKRYEKPTFWVGGFETGFTLVSEDKIEGLYTNNEDYYLYRSTYPGLGKTTIEIK